MIPVIGKITGFKETQVPDLQNILDQVVRMSTHIRYEDNATDAAKVMFGEFVIMDDGTNKRIYMRTGKDNVGYIILT